MIAALFPVTCPNVEEYLPICRGNYTLKFPEKRLSSIHFVLVQIQSVSNSICIHIIIVKQFIAFLRFRCHIGLFLEKSKNLEVFSSDKITWQYITDTVLNRMNKMFELITTSVQICKSRRLKIGAV